MKASGICTSLNLYRPAFSGLFGLPIVTSQACDEWNYCSNKVRHYYPFMDEVVNKNDPRFITQDLSVNLDSLYCRSEEYLSTEIKDPLPFTEKQYRNYQQHRLTKEEASFIETALDKVGLRHHFNPERLEEIRLAELEARQALKKARRDAFLAPLRKLLSMLFGKKGVKIPKI